MAFRRAVCPSRASIMRATLVFSPTSRVSQRWWYLPQGNDPWLHGAGTGSRMAKALKGLNTVAGYQPGPS